jgi:Ca-activated chloride channel family protein
MNDSPLNPNDIHFIPFSSFHQMGQSLSTFHDAHQLSTYVQKARIPCQDLLNGGLIASHFFDINPNLEAITQPVTAALFSSIFSNPITQQIEQILVLGLTGSEDGQNHRVKTDVILVIDRSGSMQCSVNDFIIPSHRSGSVVPGEIVESEKTTICQRRRKMELAIDAAKGIFELMDDDEQVGIFVFDHEIEMIEELKGKSEIDRHDLFSRLAKIEPRGGTDFGIGLSAALEMLKTSTIAGRNQRIIFLTDAVPTVGSSTKAIADRTDAAFVESQGFIGVTYCGIGLSFDASACAELSRARSTSIYSISNSSELEQSLTAEFNYLVSPVAFDVRVELSSSDYSISDVIGGDCDCKRDSLLLKFRTLSASAVGADGVKGSIVIIHLTPRSPDIGLRSSVQISIEFTPFGTQTRERQQHDYFINDEPMPLTEKAFALSVFYRTLQPLLPARNVRKDAFTADETVILVKLQQFLKSQRSEIVSDLEREIAMVDGLIANHCDLTRVP